MASIKNKHNHALTNWLKVIIFAIVMIAPFFAVFAGTAYTVFNKNAKDSYYGETINQKTEKHITQYSQNKNYTFYISNGTYVSTNITNGNQIYIENLEIEQYNGNATIDFSTHQYWRFRRGNESTNLLIEYYNQETNDYTWYVNLGQNTTWTLKFTLTQNNSTATDWLSQIYYYEYNNYSYLSSAFYYNVEQLKTQPLFAWTKDTGIYGTFNAMCEGLDQQDGILPLLLTYWTLNTCIYIVFDIILVTFTKIIHIISRSD